MIEDSDTRVRRRSQEPNDLLRIQTGDWKAPYQFFTLSTVLKYRILIENFSYIRAKKSGNIAIEKNSLLLTIPKKKGHNTPCRATWGYSRAG